MPLRRDHGVFRENCLGARNSSDVLLTKPHLTALLLAIQRVLRRGDFSPSHAVSGATIAKRRRRLFAARGDYWGVPGFKGVKAA